MSGDSGAEHQTGSVFLLTVTVISLFSPLPAAATGDRLTLTLTTRAAARIREKGEEMTEERVNNG